LPDLVGVLAARRRGHAAHRSPAELVWGDYHIAEQLAGQEYRVSGDSFFQSNPAQAGRMIGLVSEWASPPVPLSKTGEGASRAGLVLDLYSGVGTFLLPLARGARRAIGVEESESAVEDAKANARAGRLRNITLHERRVERILPRLAERASPPFDSAQGRPSPSPSLERGRQTSPPFPPLRARRGGDNSGAKESELTRGEVPDVVILDPPRKGCGPIVAALVAKLRPRRVILVSCHPATLARDLKSFAEHGYPCRRVQPIDMFPQTWHVEAVAVCEPVPAP